MSTTKPTVFSEIKRMIGNLDPQSITAQRKAVLEPLLDFIQTKVSNGEAIRINFICTHNSRRSHLAQVWAQTLACYFSIKDVFCYSGGTQSTSLYPAVAEVLQNSGFMVKTISEGNNPIYSIKYADNVHPIVGFSKKMNDDFNPKSEFAAIMTCSEADDGCPFVAGAEVRIPITYEDPKIYDNTLKETDKYHERSLQIATELFYVFSRIILQ